MKRLKESIPNSIKKGNAPISEKLISFNNNQFYAVIANESNGQPYTSMIAFALTPDNKGIIFSTPKDTQKYKNIIRNNRVSILIDTRSNTKEDYLNAESLTILGNATPVKKGEKWLELARILIDKHPDLNEFIHSPETELILVKINKCIHVTQFQTVTEFVPK